MLTAWQLALVRELPAAKRLREQLHANPRCSGEEGPTRDEVVAAMGVDMRAYADTGAVGSLGPRTGPSIGLRAELDALPVREATTASFASQNGAMHACGHDIHLAALVAVVRAARELELPYGLVPILQPREEAYPSGAADMVRQGVIEAYSLTHLIAAHVHPGVPAGAVAVGAGFVNAAAGELTITVRGQGGHGAYPHLAGNVAGVVASIVTQLPTVLMHTVDPMEAAVVSVGTIRVGDGAANVIPAEGTIRATLRAVSVEAGNQLAERIRQFVEQHAASHSCVGQVDYVTGEPELINDPKLAQRIVPVLEQFGMRSAPVMRSMGADDFSYFSSNIPSVMCFVGVETSAASLHDPQFLPTNESVEQVARTLLSGYIAAAGLLDGARCE